jgi:hypothetical protein
MLHPLTEVGVGVLMPIVVGYRQFMMDILCDCERRKGEQQEDKTYCRNALKNGGQTSYGSA